MMRSSQLLRFLFFYLDYSAPETPISLTNNIAPLHRLNPVSKPSAFIPA